MRRFLPFIIVAGVLIIAGVIVAPLVGTYFYMRSPQRVVTGAFQKFLDAKTFKVVLEAADDAKDGMGFNVSGSIDKKNLTQPVADLNFSFNAPAIKFSGDGKARARDGVIYLQFNKISGISEISPEALQAIWTGIGVDSLLALAKEVALPDAIGNLTEADLEELIAVAKKHVPFAVVRHGTPTFIDNVLVAPYDIVLDRVALNAMFAEIKTKVKGSSLDKSERGAIDKFVSSIPSLVGEVWVAKNDGTLRGILLIAKNNNSSFHLSLRFSDYDKNVPSDPPPTGAKPLFELIRRLFGTSLSGVKPKLPFDLPVPIYDINMGIPEITGSSSVSGGKKEKTGALPNLIRLFYGTDQPFGGNNGK